MSEPSDHPLQAPAPGPAATATPLNVTDALSAFIALTEAAGVSTDVPGLVQTAGTVLRACIPDAAVRYFELQGGQWTLRGGADGQPTPLPGVPPSFARALEAGGPVFSLAWDAVQQGVPSTEGFRVVALARLLQGTEPAAILLAGSVSGAPWTSVQREVFSAVARSLDAALRRARLGQAQERQAALDAFVTLTEAIGTETNQLRLAERAKHLILSFLPGWAVVYYTLHGTERGPLWKAQVVEVPDAALEAQLRAGMPYDTPAYRAALQAQGPVFVDGWDAEEQRFERTEDYGLAAFYPYFRQGQPVGLLAIGTTAARRWTPADRSVFLAVGRSLGLALDWAGQAEQLWAQNEALDNERAGLDAFAAFTEAVGSETEVLALAERAIQVIQANLSGVSVTYFELQHGLWQPLAWSGDIPVAVVEELRAGVPQSAPSFAQGAQTPAGVFVDGWNASDDLLENAAMYGAAAFIPVHGGPVEGGGDGPPQRLLGVGTRVARAWTERERTLVRAVARGLSLAVERAEAAQRLALQNAELEGRTRALEGFAQLTSELGALASTHDLVRRAQEVVLSLIPAGYALYYEKGGRRWRNTVQVGDVGNAELQAFIDDGPLVGETPTVDIPWATQQPFYQDQYDQGSDTPAEIASHVNAAAALPVVVGGETVGVFIAALFEFRAWTRLDQVVLETVVRSLALAVERAAQTQALDNERAGLDAFAAFSEAVGSETEVLVLARQAIHTVRTALPNVSMVYFEPQDGLWRALAVSDDIVPEIVTQLEAGVPQDAPNFVAALAAGEPQFVDTWDAEANSLRRVRDQQYHSVVFAPILVEGEPYAFVTAGLPMARTWTAREQAVIRAAVQGLTQMLARTEQTRQLQVQQGALNARTASLSAANQELEAFTYSASHDLRTPVRHVMGFSELAKTAMERNQPDKVLKYLEVVQQGAVRMSALIDGMLVLSRTGSEGFTAQAVELDAVVTQARRDVSAEFAGRRVRWQVSALPVVWGDQGMLQQVMTNLISNAVKYSGTRETSEVRVWVDEREHEWLISVQDNGVGFDPRYAQKLFGVFQRLHSQKEFEGTGVGLATVRRIVLKHGGQVFAHSTGDSGATFSFSLPKPG